MSSPTTLWKHKLKCSPPSWPRSPNASLLRCLKLAVHLLTATSTSFLQTFSVLLSYSAPRSFQPGPRLQNHLSPTAPLPPVPSAPLSRAPPPSILHQTLPLQSLASSVLSAPGRLKHGKERQDIRGHSAEQQGGREKHWGAMASGGGGGSEVTASPRSSAL